MYLPLLDGSDQVGVMALTLDHVDDYNRRLLRRLSSLVADMVVHQARVHRPVLPGPAP
ncbi:hypothetical protein GCM10010271_71140 [Streptomyces kurssanovii]|nr:hypothetical protein GCM10010271_71140 [Streptomyces kurssanovii]